MLHALTRTVALLALSLLALPAHAHAGNGLIGIEGSSNQVFQIDPLTAAVIPIGQVTGVSSPLGGLDIAPDGFYYGKTIGSGPRLYRIDPITFAATIVAQLSSSFRFEGGLAISATGEAWGVNGSGANSAQLFKIDLVTGTDVVVGVMGNADINGLLVRTDGQLLGIDRVTNSVVEIDPVTAVITTLAPLGVTVGAGGGLARFGGQIYGCTSGSGGSNELFTVDPLTGVATFVGVISGPLSSVGFYALGSTDGGGAIGAPYCFGDGAGAICPCANFGGRGEGCSNTSGGGARLSAGGFASLQFDTFRLEVEGVPGSKPGLILRGANAIANPAGDGLLCTGGQSLRSQIQVTQNGLTTFNDFQGAPFGASSFGIGAPTHYQFWYRDPQSVCGGAGFNFSNGYAVTWLP